MTTFPEPIKKTPTHELPDPVSFVKVFHPNSLSTSPLILFPAYDRLSGGPWGVCFPVVLEAASIIANNQDGYISTTRGPEGRVPNTAILEAGHYFFIVADAVGPYPVIHSFSAWHFPGAAPSRWVNAMNPNIPPQTGPAPASQYESAQMATRLGMRDDACLLTGISIGESSLPLICIICSPFLSHVVRDSGLSHHPPSV